MVLDVCVLTKRNLQLLDFTVKRFMKLFKTLIDYKNYKYM